MILLSTTTNHRRSPNLDFSHQTTATARHAQWGLPRSGGDIRWNASAAVASGSEKSGWAAFSIENHEAVRIEASKMEFAHPNEVYPLWYLNIAVKVAHFQEHRHIINATGYRFRNISLQIELSALQVEPCPMDVS